MQQPKLSPAIMPKAPRTCPACNTPLTSKFAAKHHACRGVRTGSALETSTK